ncbi:TAR DNA-binding protein 43-like [Stylophora pistillata]|uniref:TAR DNA-binding protein 43 n=1 Tax=Stylophora pistillata TaxID=50429 RepID=A0A2B4SBQ9_STYPI|nr:TAR DNA-binding protein 43-like [Stylophora pistillata]PFX26250.1 TAR DNA-binding protein 43 [Stylophora pistillata]
MAQYVRVTEDESLPAIEVPTEADGTILLSTLQAQFPGACGLRYKNPETDSWRGIRLLENMLCPPAEEGWGGHLYVVVQKNDSTSKRKIEESPNTKAEPETKMTKISSPEDGLGDLIVLGLPWKTTAEDMKEYFQKFGEIVMAEVKMDYGSSKSRGFGFVNFKDPEVAKTVLSQVHRIQGRLCEVRLPRCKQEFMPKKLFVGRLPDSTNEGDLLDYFSKFGEVIDVYIPKPMRGISFVTFASGEVAKKVQSQNHRLGSNLLNVNFAEPKAAKNVHMPSPADMQSMSQNSLPGWGGMGFPEMYGMGSWNNAGRQNMPYNASAAYNSMMQSMMNMGNPSGASNMMANRHGRR